MTSNDASPRNGNVMGTSIAKIKQTSSTVRNVAKEKFTVEKIVVWAKNICATEKSTVLTPKTNGTAVSTPSDLQKRFGCIDDYFQYD